jgi:hypothetical protein
MLQRVFIGSATSPQARVEYQQHRPWCRVCRSVGFTEGERRALLRGVSLKALATARQANAAIPAARQDNEPAIIDFWITG